jgi:hypothetical protein
MVAAHAAVPMRRRVPASHRTVRFIVITGDPTDVRSTCSVQRPGKETSRQKRTDGKQLHVFSCLRHGPFCEATMEPPGKRHQPERGRDQHPAECVEEDREPQSGRTDQERHADNDANCKLQEMHFRRTGEPTEEGLCPFRAKERQRTKRKEVRCCQHDDAERDCRNHRRSPTFPPHDRHAVDVPPTLTAKPATPPNL